ncbi:hypothetical protein ACFQZX_08755 [Mucilaginibacter litoreus]|uniref:NlpE N-terminal domain-containing protein n=1 Tax=Mucilaginibacter litoreus TaxID=1048221 RepID=A0ABW3AS62_9SPHI
MVRYISLFAFLIIIGTSCNNSTKPKPVSDDITKTAVTVNGKKDSIINNPQKKYTSVATVPDPCIKCLIGVIQNTPEFKQLKSGDPGNINYIINWEKAATSADSVSKSKSTNGLQIVLQDKSKNIRMPQSFIYSNSQLKLYSVNNNTKTEIAVKKADLNRIRNTCYWGVASAK